MNLRFCLGDAIPIIHTKSVDVWSPGKIVKFLKWTSFTFRMSHHISIWATHFSRKNPQATRALNIHSTPSFLSPLIWTSHSNLTSLLNPNVTSFDPFLLHAVIGLLADLICGLLLLLRLSCLRHWFVGDCLWLTTGWFKDGWVGGLTLFVHLVFFFFKKRICTIFCSNFSVLLLSLF